MNILKLFSLLLLLIGAFALKDDQVDRSSVTLDEATNDQKSSAEVQLYEKDDDVDELHGEEMLEDEKSLSDPIDESRLEKRNPIACAIRRFACFVACGRVPRAFRRACRRVCNFGLRYANRAVCYVACRRVHPIIRGICYYVCRCLR